MTLNNDQELDLNTLLKIGRQKAAEIKYNQETADQKIRLAVIDAYKLPASLWEFVSTEPAQYEFGNHYIWLRIPGLLPIKLLFNHYTGYKDELFATSCTVMHGEEPYLYSELSEALAKAQELADQPIPPAAQKIDEDTINAAYDELERTTRNAHQFDPDREWASEIAELKVRRLAAILNFRTKDALLNRYQNQDG